MVKFSLLYFTSLTEIQNSIINQPWLRCNFYSREQLNSLTPFVPISSHAAVSLLSDPPPPPLPPPQTTFLRRRSFRRSITNPNRIKDHPPMKSWPSGKHSSALPCSTTIRNPSVNLITLRNFFFYLLTFLIPDMHF